MRARGINRSLLAVALLAGAGVAAPNTQDQPIATGLRSVAFPESPGAHPVDESEAMVQARSLGRAVEVAGLTSPTLKVMAKPEGIFEAEVSPAPVRVREAGRWVDADPSLVTDSGGRLAPRAAAVDLSFSPGGSSELVSLGSAQGRLGLSWLEDLPEPVIEGALATYREVLPGVDLVTQAGVEGFATYFVVKSRQAGANLDLDRLEFALATDDAEVVDRPDGSIDVVDAQGKSVFHAAQPRMWDSRGAAFALPEPAADVVAEAQGAGAQLLAVDVVGGKLRLRPDRAFLSDPQTTYPVIIDPTWSTQSDEEFAWAMVWSNGMEWFNSSTQQARVGYDGWSSAAKKSRTFYKFNTSFFLDKRINSATLRHHQVHSPSYQCDTTIGPAVEVWRADGFGPGVSWPGPALNDRLATNSEAHGHEDYCPGYDLNEWSVTQAVNWAVNQGENRLTLAMVSANESNKDGWRQYKDTSSAQPKLVVEYNTPPDVPAAPSVVNANTYTDDSRSYTRDRTPKFTARLTDADGDQLWARFRVGPEGSGATWTHDTAWVGSGTTVTSAAVPSGEINADGTYWAEVKAYDDETNSVYSERTKFVVDTVAPAAPSVRLPIADPSYDNGGRFKFSSTSGDVYKYKYGFTTSTTNMEKKANGDGGPATVIYTPTTFGPDWVTAEAVDRAGNVSEPVPADERIDFRVKGTEATHHWPLDSDGTDIVGGATLTTASAPGWGAGRYRDYDPLQEGSVTWAGSDDSLVLDGVADHAATVAGLLDTSKSFTVSAWVKLDPQAQGSYQTAVSQVGASASAFYLGYNKDGWAFWVRGEDASASAVVAKTPHTLPAQPQWTHLVGVYRAPRKASDRQVLLYVNGHLQAEMPAPEGVFKANGPFLVGRAQYNQNPSNFWAGEIDDVRAFPGSLDPLGALALSAEIRDQEVSP